MSKESPAEPSLPMRLLTAGTAGCVADILTFPFDTAKVRLQIQGEKSGEFKYRGLFGTIFTLVREEGVKSLYNGLIPGLIRQMFFASIRLGAYEPVKNFYIKLLNENPDSLNVGTRILAGVTTGVIGVCIGQPTDVLKVRFQAETTLGDGRFKIYNALNSIIKKEGVKGLWRGNIPNIARNAILNVCETTVYDISKDVLIKKFDMKDNIYCHLTGGIIAGVVTTLVVNPVDVVKTRYMNSTKNQYTGTIDCAIQMRQGEGFTAFYKGFIPSIVRLSSWNIVLWISYEELKKYLF